jgi:hypothetical protein
LIRHAPTIVSACVLCRNVIRDVPLLSKPVFEMFFTLESQLVGTKPYPPDCSSKQIRYPVLQWGCHPPGGARLPEVAESQRM